MPHGNNMEDYEVDAVYSRLEELKQHGDESGYHTIWAGDFHAEVGPRKPDDESDIMGNSLTHRGRNGRGEWLLDTCSDPNSVYSTRIPRNAMYISGHTGLEKNNWITSSVAKTFASTRFNAR